MRRQSSLAFRRGCASTVFWGFVGLLTPFLCGLVATVVHWWQDGTPASHRRVESLWFLTDCLVPVLICGALMAGTAAATRFPKGAHRFGVAAGWVIASSCLMWYTALLLLSVGRPRGADPISLLACFFLLVYPPLITATLLVIVRTSSQEAAAPPDALPGSRGVLARVEPVIALVFACIVAMLTWWWPKYARHPEVPLRLGCQDNLRELAVAAYDYEQRNGLPLEDLRSPDGKPLLSWRVALLPFLNQGDLIERFRVEEPWDSDHNIKLLRLRPDIYVCPRIDDMRDECTGYVLVGRDGQRIIFEAGQSQISWTKPDGGLEWQAAVHANTGVHPGYFLVGYKDTREVKKTGNMYVRLSQFPIEKGDLPDVEMEWVSVETKAAP